MTGQGTVNQGRGGTGRYGGGRGRGAGRGRGSFKPAIGPQEVPTLKYGPYNNWVLYRERIVKSALEKYGDLGRLIEDEAYYVPPEIDQTKYDLVNDPNGLNKLLLQEALKARQKNIIKMESDRANFYGYILGTISNESLDELKRAKDYSKFNSELDVLALRKALKLIHMTQTTSKVDAIVSKAAKDDYNNMRQTQFQSITEYKAEFDSRLLAYEQHGNPNLSDNQIAMDFLYGLDKYRYASFI